MPGLFLQYFIAKSSIPTGLLTRPQGRDMKDSFFKLTPLGRADLLLNEYLSDEDRDEQIFKDYQTALNKYRNLKLFQITIKTLLYAGVITSIVASLGIEQIRIISRISSYIGVTVLLASYAIINYATLIYREEYHVKREVLVSQTEIRQE